MTGVWPLGVYFLAVLVLVAGMLFLSHLLGQRHDERATGEPYESGIVSTGSARIRFSVKFYLIAMLFVIFDLEAAFIIAWPIAFRDVGWPGYLGVLVFIGVLIAALVYEWRLGVLEWGRDHWKVSRKLFERRSYEKRQRHFTEQRQ
jgi:NADH-quinone oxidoreductase subunit A